MSLKSFFSSKIPLSQAIFWIVGSTFAISTCSYHAMKWYFIGRLEKEKQLPSITYIVQTGPQRQALHSDYLAQLLGLSFDNPTSLREFDAKSAELQLLQSPVIQSAKVQTIQPNIVYIDYTVRQPIAWIYDYLNVAIDRDGFLLPVYPFFSPKNLPEIYLGLPLTKKGENFPWNQPVKGKSIELAFSLLQLLQTYGTDLFILKRIDVSQAFAESYGRREIVLQVENEVSVEKNGVLETIQIPHILRLSTKDYPKELANYLQLRVNLLEKEEIKLYSDSSLSIKERVIDLRIPQLAYIE